MAASPEYLRAAAARARQATVCQELSENLDCVRYLTADECAAC